MIQELLAPEMLIALITLIFLEIILGVDNIIFISIVTNKLPKEKQKRGRTIGLTLAMVFRVMLLLAITWIIQLTNPIFTIPKFLFIQEAVPISVRDLILIAGGLFLMAKSVSEMHHKVEDIEEGEKTALEGKAVSMLSILAQIVVLDMVFSFDSILTAIGLIDVDNTTEYFLPTGVVVMIIAVVISIFVMMAFAGAISDFINKQPTLQILALSFLILIGVMLIADGFHFHIPKGYLYFSVAFALGVEAVNIKLRKKID
ncbi:MAG: putative tellurium resistance membrane protein TerC [Chitinophagales bacterium]|jgi:predicted tellurium resistance membrane protein TerC